MFALRGTKADDRDKLKTVTRTASAVPTELPKSAKRAAADTTDDSNSLRTAFTAPPPPGTLLSGAQPTLPAGTFASRWSAWR